MYLSKANTALSNKNLAGSIGTPLTATATKVLLLGSGELGKEVAIELQRFGVEVIAVDRYKNAPAMQVAHASYVISMTDENALRALIAHIQPDIIVPEIEALATTVLLESEAVGINVIPTAYAAHTTMNRQHIRTLAHELGLKTSAYRFAYSKEEYFNCIREIGFPCVIKPIMSSSGKGQSIINNDADCETAWNYACSGGRTQTTAIIIEEFIPFDYEITLLTIRTQKNTIFCEPIGHLQINGDYRESWQPHSMDEQLLAQAQTIAKTITDRLGGLGLFGVELFIQGTDIYFSEVSPRPHDTGMVTMISQEVSEFALHARALLGLPIPNITHLGPSASCALMLNGISTNITYHNLSQALAEKDTQIRLFGKPDIQGHRRMGVALARGKTIEEARAKARAVAESISYTL